MDWFNIIKDFSDTEIFDALGLDQSLTDYSADWDEEHKRVTLRALNFMKGLPNVEWKSSRRGDYTPDEIDIYGEVTVGDVMITTPKVNISNIGIDVSYLGDCEATTVTKDGYIVRICVNPDYASKQPWGDFLASSVLFYTAILTQDIPSSQTKSPELVWLAGVAKDKTKIEGSSKDKWKILYDVVVGRWAGITDRNWRILMQELENAIKQEQAKAATRNRNYDNWDYRDVEG